MEEESYQIIADLPCVSCGYNLRTQPVEGLCPECGGRICKSLDDTILSWGPRFLAQLADRVFWVAVTALAVPLAMVGGYILRDILARQLYFAYDDHMSIRHYYAVVSLGMLLPFVAAVLVHVIAVWRFTCAPDGKRLGRHQIVIRVGAMMFLAAALEPLLQLIVNLLDDERSSLLVHTQYIQLALPVLLLGLALYPQQAAEYIADLYRRAGLASKTAFAMWSLWLFSTGVLMLDAAVVLVLMDMFRLARTGRSSENVVILLLLVGVGVMLLGLLGTVIALFKFRSRMRALARIAPSKWTELIVKIPQPEASA